MSETLNHRQNLLLQGMSYEDKYALSDLMKVLQSKTSAATLRRDLTLLKEKGYLTTEGERKGTRYWLTVAGLLNATYEPHAYCSRPIDARGGKKEYFFDLFEKFPNHLFSKEELIKLELASHNYRKKLKVSDAIARKELERFVIELSWKSSRIEGNTYTLSLVAG